MPISSATIKDRYGPILEQLAATGTLRLVEHLGPAACQRQREVSFVSEKICKLEEFARKFNVTISIEVAPGDAIYDVKEFKQFFSHAGPKLRFTLDVCHVLCEGRRIEDYLVNIGERVDYVHLMDVDFLKSEIPKQVCLGDWRPVGASNSLCGPVSLIYDAVFRGPWVIENECYFFSRTAISFNRVLKGLGITCGFFQTVQDFEDDILKRSVKWLENYLKSKRKMRSNN
jgi:sugar phosphate isomerase/epimerase